MSASSLSRKCIIVAAILVCISFAALAQTKEQPAASGINR